MAKPSIFDSIPTKTEKTKKSSIPLCVVPGGIIARYVDACDRETAAKAEKEEMAADLVVKGLRRVFAHNCENPGAPLASVNLVSAEESEELDVSKRERVQFSWSVKNLKNDPAHAAAVIASLVDKNGKPVDPKSCVEWQLAAEFDTNVFKVEGKFNEARAKRIIEALKIVSEELGIENPVSFTKTLVPKADFQEKRFERFDLETNLTIFSVLPNGTTLKPIRPVKVED
jgi:hypothetical protein